MDKRTLGAFDQLCLTPLRAVAGGRHPGAARERVSQAAFARYLNVSTGLVSQ